MKTVNITLKGISPLLMHAFPVVPIENPPLEKRSVEEQAELAAYRDPDSGNLYVPAVALQRALIAAAVYSKGKGRASLQKQAAACLYLSPERVDLGVSEYQIDSRPVVIPATRGRIVRHRPRLDEWQITFRLDFDEDLLTQTQVRKIVDDMCSRVGILDFRPERKGPFGRSMVVKWESS